MIRFLAVVIMVLALLNGCAGKDKYNPSKDFILVSNNFCEAMRWKDFLGAARFVVAPEKDKFLELFEEDRDLFVVNSRVKKIELEENENGATVEYEMEYYHLPSSRVRTWIWTQKWTLVREETLKQGVWLIEEAPSELPWKK